MIWLEMMHKNHCRAESADDPDSAVRIALSVIIDNLSCECPL
ncbi:hypothetical protein [Endozoicomonas sp. ONNA2]|nr:hypothetical protein [Endozoicomonas sp. ONNA2]